MKSKIIKFLSVICLCISCIGCSPFINKNIANVTVTKVKSSDSINSTVYTTNISSDEDIDIFPSSVGKVKSINVEVGKKIKKNDVLFTIDDTELSYKLNIAKANYDSAKANYDKVASGSAKQAQADAEKLLESAKNELKNAEEAYEIEKNQYSNNTNITSTQAAYDSAKLNFDRKTALYEADAISQVEYESAQYEFDKAKSALDIAIDNASKNLSIAESRFSNAKASYNSASTNATITNSIINPDNIAAAKASAESAKASLDLAQYAFDNAAIKSPIDGKVSEKSIKIGEYTSTQTPSIVVTGENNLCAKIEVTETKIQNIKKGMKADIYIPSSGITYEGNVYSIAPSADSKTGMFDIKISVNNKDKSLKVGTVANVTLKDNKKDNSLLIPSKCVFKENNNSYVYVINNDLLNKRKVKTTKNINEYMVIDEGLKKDDEVVIEGSANMTDNMKYNIVKNN